MAGHSGTRIDGKPTDWGDGDSRAVARTGPTRLCRLPNGALPRSDHLPYPTAESSALYFQGLIYDRYGGDLLANQPVSRLDSQYFFTRESLSRLVGEWDQGDDEVSGDLLVSYQPSPATLVFLGYREENAFGEGDPIINRSVFAKFSYLFAY